MDTLKYKRASKEKTMTTEYNMSSICVHCKRGIEKVGGPDAVWLHTPHEHREYAYTYCRPHDDSGNMATPDTNSRMSGTNERESSDLVQQMLMKMNPTICTAIYRDDQGHKLYCNLPKDHKEDCGSCPKPEARVLPLPPTTGRSVYCVHCQQFHPPRDHRVSLDYPPIPYAREHFITRQADLRGEMENYIAGRLNQDDLVGVIQRIEAEYVQAMNDLHTQGLI
jgi:hypothetical protein